MNGMDTALHITWTLPFSNDSLKTYIIWPHFKNMAIERFQSDDSLVPFPFLMLFSFHPPNDQLTTQSVDGVEQQINVKMTSMCCHQNAEQGYYVLTVKLFDKCDRNNVFWRICFTDQNYIQTVAAIRPDSCLFISPAQNSEDWNI